MLPESKSKINKIKFNVMGWFKNSIILIGLIVLIVIFSITSEYFLTISNILDIIRNMAVIGISAAGVLFVIISGGIDISIGSVVGLGGIIFFAMHNLGVPLIFSIIIGMISGAFIGFINGLMINEAKITPLVATLVTMGVARGICYAYTKGVPIALLPSRSRDEVNYIAGGKIYGVPVAIIIILSIFFILWFFLDKTKYGIQLKSVGKNEVASIFNGINVNKIRYIAYLISGVCAATAGIILASKTISGQHLSGVGLEFKAITAVILGGASLSGGKGNIWATLIGVSILGVLENGMNMLNITYYYQLVLQAIIIIVAVGFDQFRGKRGL